MVQSSGRMPIPKLTGMVSNVTYAVILTAFALLFLPPSTIAAQESVVIEVWIHPGNNFPDIMAPLIEKFNASRSDVQIALPIVTGFSDERVNIAIASGTPPDIVHGSFQWNPAWAERGLLVDLWPYIERDGLKEDLEDFFPAALEVGGKYKGELIGLPFYMQLDAIYYNTGLLQRAGIEPSPGAHWTWEEFAAALTLGRALISEGSNVQYPATANHISTATNQFIEQAGLALWHPQSLRPSLEFDKVERAYGMVQDLVQRELLFVTGWGAFVEGQALFHLDLNTRLNVLENAADFVRVLPTLRMDRASPPATWMGLRTWNILKSNPSREAAAWEVLKYLTSTEVLLEFTGRALQVAPRRSVLGHPEYRRLTSVSPNFEALLDYVAPYGTGLAGVPDIGKIYSEALWPLGTEVLNGTLPIPSFREQLAQAIDRILAPYRE